ncbi:MAG: D-alanine--D-alanine ligase [bacterium]
MSRKSIPKGLRVGLVYDLRGEYLAAGYSEEEVAEFDSDETVAELAGAMRSLGCRVDRIGNARTLCRRLAAGDRWQLVFSIAEGLYGRSREAQVPAVLELFEIPYAFSDPLACAVTLDKAAAKTIVRHAGLRTPDFRVVRRPADAVAIRMGFPLFAKPIAEGTGKGIDELSLIESHQALQKVCRRLLKRFRQPVLIETFLPGREFTVGILGTGCNARVLGTMEVEVLPASGRSIYSLDMKERCEELVRYSPLRDRKLAAQIERLALDCYVALECRDAGRVDVRLDATGRAHFLEVNPIPGLHPTHSDLPMIATQQGMSYPDLIGAIIESSLLRTRT